MILFASTPDYTVRITPTDTEDFLGKRRKVE